MEDQYEEFDLRPFIQLLLKHWKFIMGTAVIFAITTLIISQLMPPEYQATALLAETDPQDKILLDPNANTVSAVIGDKLPTYISIATSDDALQQLFTSIQPPLGDIVTMEDIRKLVHADMGKDSGIVELTVAYNDPVRTAEIVNLWAEQSIADVNTFYNGRSDQQLVFLEEQLAQTLINQENAKVQLADFQSTNSISTISNELYALDVAQSEYLAQANELAHLTGNIVALRTQLGEQSGPLSAAEQLTALVLHTQVFDAQTDFTIQLQADVDTGLDKIDRAEQIEQLDTLMATIESQQTQIAKDVAALTPRILSLQEEKQMVESTLNGLTQKKDILDEAITVLSRKVEEERIASQNINSGIGIRLISKAAVPEKTTNSSTLVSTFLAAVIGVLLAVGFIFARDWWEE